MKSFSLIIAILCLSISTASSQTFDWDATLRKYWKARGRLIGDENNRKIYNGFMVIGDQPGMSLPAEQRMGADSKGGRYDIVTDKDGIGNRYVSANGCGLPNITNTTVDPRTGKPLGGEIKWGDATIQLAHYLIALAYEHALMRRSGDPDIWRTEREIYYALKAIKRLDIMGESYIPHYNISGPHENGFFVRDDVPKDFALNYMGEQYNFVSGDRACTTNGLANEMSYDQYIAVMLGLRMVFELVPSNTSFNGENLRSIVQDISRRSTDRIVYQSMFPPPAYWPTGSIMQPSNNIFDNSFSTVTRGPNVAFAFFPMVATASEIAGFPMVPTGINPFSGSAFVTSPLYGISGINNLYIALGQLVYDECKTGLALSQASSFVVSTRHLAPTGAISIQTSNAIFGTRPEHDNRNDNVNMMLQSMIASRQTGVNWVPWNPLLWGVSYIDPSGEKTIYNIASKYRKELYQLMGATVMGYNYSGQGLYDFWQGEFNKLPCACNCVYPDDLDPGRETDENGCVNLQYTTSSTNPAYQWTLDHPWTTSNRWEHWMREPSSLPYNYREYAGIDFMESFGGYMYQLHRNMGLMQNIRVNIFNNFPISHYVHAPINSPTIGNPIVPMYQRAVFSMDVKGLYKGEIDGSFDRAMVSLNAGSNIDFVPGFYAEHGSTVNAEIKPFECTPQEKVFNIPAFLSFYNPNQPGVSAWSEGLKPSRDNAALDDSTGSQMVDSNWLKYAIGQYDTSHIANTIDSLYVPFTDTVREQFVDTTVMRKWLSNDTLYIEMDSCWP